MKGRSTGRHVALAAGTVLLAITATGCTHRGAAAPATPSYPTSTVPLTSASSNTSAVAGSTVSRDKSFSLVTPAGWSPVASTLAGVQLFVRAPTDTHGVRSNLSIYEQPSSSRTSMADVLQDSEAQSTANGYAVTDAPATTVGGVHAEGFVATKVVQKQPLTQRYYFVQHGSAFYVSIFTSSSADATEALAQQSAALGTWAWSAS